MEKTTQHAPFFVEDLYPHVDEVGNAMWGRHIANNFTRLLDVRATLVFDEWSKWVTISGGRRVLLANLGQSDSQVIPISQYGFRAIPSVEMWAKTTAAPSGTYGTIFAPATTLGAGTMPYPLDSITATFIYDFGTDPSTVAWLYEFNRFYTLNQPGTMGWFLKLDNEILELMRYTADGMSPTNPAATLYLYTRRGEWNSVAAAHAISTPIGLLRAQDITSAQVGTAYELPWEYNPAWVDALMYQDALIVNWYHPYSGTVLLKIFGV